MKEAGGKRSRSRLEYQPQALYGTAPAKIHCQIILVQIYITLKIMAPIKTVRNKVSSKGAKGGKNTKSAIGANMKSRISKKSGRKAPPPRQQKTKSSSGPVKKKRRVYTDKELDIPKLNMITPVGVDLPKGRKKGKVFIDDEASLRDLIVA